MRRNIFAKIACSIILLVVLCYIGVGAFAGFHTKGIPCKGGFLTSFYQGYIEEIKSIAGEALEEPELAQIKANLTIDKDNDKIITTHFTNEHGEVVELRCTMKWYWNDDYIWSNSKEEA